MGQLDCCWRLENAIVHSASKNGWVDSTIFFFFKKTLTICWNRRLIIYDGHATHVDLEMVYLARSSHISIINLPVHSSHLLQPLDLTVFKLLKVAWNAKMVSLQRMHLGLKLPKSIFCTFYGETWLPLNPDIIDSELRKAGICPFNLEVISPDK
jgi:hypothetical protein